MKHDIFSDAPECYGAFETAKPGCKKCVYASSCRYYRETEAKMEERLHMVRFEFVQNWSELLADTSHIPGEEGADPDMSRRRRGLPPETDIADMAQFLHFILELDDYTLAILAQIIVPDKNTAQTCSMAELARIHHCTRQAIHRKFLRTARRNPELARLLQLTFRKVRTSRSAFLRGHAAAGRRA